MTDIALSEVYETDETRRVDPDWYLPDGFVAVECGCGDRAPARADGDLLHVPEVWAAAHDDCPGDLVETATTLQERYEAACAIREARIAAAGPQEAILMWTPSMYALEDGILATRVLPDLHATGHPGRAAPRRFWPPIAEPVAGSVEADQMRLW